MAVATMAGVAVGLIGALALTRSVASLVFGVSTYDWVSFVAGPVLLIFAAALACVAPAQQVAATDPLQVLREARR